MVFVFNVKTFDVYKHESDFFLSSACKLGEISEFKTPNLDGFGKLQSDERSQDPVYIAAIQL